MLKLLIAAIGFSCLMPGIAIVTLGPIGVQPVLLLFGFYCIIFPLSGLRLPLPPMLWALANVSGFLVSYLVATLAEAGQHGLEFAIFESLFYTAAAVGFGTVLIVPVHRRIFLDGYVAAALVSSAVGIVQALASQTTGVFLRFANNDNFSLVVPIGRAVAFTPEASVLAGLLLPAFVCVWFERGRPQSLLSAPLGGRAALALLLAGLIATRSSLLLLTPAILLVTALFSARDWKGFVASSGRILTALTVAGIFFLPIYQARIDGADDAGWSEAWRALKISAGLKVAADNPILGAGPGYVSDTASFSRHLDIPRNMAWMAGQPQKGIDSTPVRVLAEDGVLGLSLAYYPLLVFWRRGRTAAQTDGWRPLFSLAVPLLFVQAVAIGYRDLVMFLLPAILFTVAGRSSAGVEPRVAHRVMENLRRRFRPASVSAINTLGD